MIAPHHLELLAAAAIDRAVAEAAGVRTVEAADALPAGLEWVRAVPGLVFPWHSPSGSKVEQYRPDMPPIGESGKPIKYVFPRGTTSVLNVHPWVTPRLATAKTIVIVEGTKQTLAAVTAAQGDPDVAVVGVAGCWGWRTDHRPVEDLAVIGVAGRDVVVIFDADIATNHQVHAAAVAFGKELKIRGARSVKWARLPADGGDKTGLDDLLAARRGPDGATADVFKGVLRIADGRLPAAPPAPVMVARPTFEVDGPLAYFDQSGSFLVQRLYEDTVAATDLAVDSAGRLLIYRDGVYRADPELVRSVVCKRLGDHYRTTYWSAWREFATASLVADGRRIEDRPNHGLLNVANGMLDPRTGRLHPHDPKYLSVAQLPIAWDPAATCPTFDVWLPEVAPGQADELLDVCSAMVDPARTQPKAAILEGPTRSAKSTMVRILQAVAGLENTAAVTLHQVCTSRFYAAELHGKILNAASDISAAHVEDLAVFKQLTGDDDIAAERKFGQPFRFRNRALFVFSMNTIPTVGEVSGAYLERIRPFLFPHSYAGREDPTIEGAMMAELPGILRRLVEAAQAHHRRGGYLPGNQAIKDRFAQRSDRTRLFVAECTDPDPDGFVSSSAMYEAFETWAKSNGRQAMGRNKFTAALEAAGLVRGREGRASMGARGWKGVTLRPESEWGEADDPMVAMFATLSTTSSRGENREISREEGKECSFSDEGEVRAELAKLATVPVGDRLSGVEEW